ncbi:MAG: hypothetical protein RIS92_1159 [Verrucomicrobiota bacterium]|jgi:hypothetical protein
MNTSRRLHPLIERISAPPPLFPAVEIPAHLRKRSKRIDKRIRLLLWWLTYRLAVERNVDKRAVKEAAEKTRLTPQEVYAVMADYPIHWERVLLKRTLRLNHQRKHGSVPDGVTPGWPLGRHVTQFAATLTRRQRSLEKKPLKLLRWAKACLLG